MAKEKKKKEKEPKTLKQKIMVGFVIISAVVFLPSTMLLIVGMAPTFVATFIVRKNRRSKAVTIGSMNLAGCIPALLHLWTKGHTIEKSFDMMSNPMVVVIMYIAAAFGYILYWSIVTVVSGVMYQKAVKETDTLRKAQEDLIKRWGLEVTGEVKLNEFGFPLEGELERAKKERAKREKELDDALKAAAS
ncbi:MAG: hypothetical protein AAF182_00525 [Pseudomonadota bacterium]